MSGIASRVCRIKYDADGSGGSAAVEIARSVSDTFEISNSTIDVTSKDDDGVKTLLNDVAMKEAKGAFTCVAASIAMHKTLIGLAANAGAGTMLHRFEIDLPGLGDFVGLFAVTNFKFGAETTDGRATFEMSLEGSGAIAWTAEA